MAVSIEPYRDLNYALRKFRGQVMESIPYAAENFPSLSSPQAVFNYMKPRVTYINDVQGREQFQTLQTMMENNIHGIPGAGDCDCFTIGALAALIANGFYNVGIVLAGRNAISARHIYVYATDANGKDCIIDLTNGSYNYERFYPYKQRIPFVLSQKEKQMLLQLADGPGHAPHPYIHFKNKGVQVREDYYDNMSAGEFQHMCLSEGIPPHEILALSSRRAQRRENNASGELKPAQQRRMNKKAQKPRNIRKQTNADSKADKRRLTGQSKVDRANKPRPQRITPVGPPASYSNYPDNAGYDGYDEEEIEVVDSEDVSPEEQYEDQMEETFLGDGTSYVKPVLWLVGLAALGLGIAYGRGKYKQYKTLKGIAA